MKNNPETASLNRDTSYINGLVDNWSNELKTKLNMKHQKLLMSIDSQYQQEIKEEKKKFCQITEGLISQVDALQKSASSLQKDVKKKNKIIENLVSTINSKNKKIKLMRSFHDWKNRTDSLNRQTKIGLAKQLNEIKKNEKAHINYESSLKSALLRGVCALNLETASIFTGPMVENQLDNYTTSQNAVTDPILQKRHLQQPQSMFVTPNPLVTDVTGQQMTNQYNTRNSRLTHSQRGEIFTRGQTLPGNHAALPNSFPRRAAPPVELFASTTNTYPINLNSIADWGNHYTRFQQESDLSHQNYSNNAQQLTNNLSEGLKCRHKVVRPMVESYMNNHAAVNLNQKRLLFNSANESWNLQINANYMKNLHLPQPNTKPMPTYFCELINSTNVGEKNVPPLSEPNSPDRFYIMDHFLYDPEETASGNGRKGKKSSATTLENHSSVESIYIEKHNRINALTNYNSKETPIGRNLFVGAIYND